MYGDIKLCSIRMRGCLFYDSSPFFMKLSLYEFYSTHSLMLVKDQDLKQHLCLNTFHKD